MDPASSPCGVDWVMGWVASSLPSLWGDSPPLLPLWGGPGDKEDRVVKPCTHKPEQENDREREPTHPLPSPRCHKQRQQLPQRS